MRKSLITNSVLFILYLMNFYYLCKMNSISIEVLPFILMDVFYFLHRNGKVSVQSASINGINIPLTDTQKETLRDEVVHALNDDFDNDDLEVNYFYDN